MFLAYEIFLLSAVLLIYFFVGTDLSTVFFPSRLISSALMLLYFDESKCMLEVKSKDTVFMITIAVCQKVRCGNPLDLLVKLFNRDISERILLEIIILLLNNQTWLNLKMRKMNQEANQ